MIDPAGDARRALQAVVAQYGPEALSNAVIMDGICQARLSNLPGEAILIGSAARTDVPALLRNLIPRLGNYGAIQSAATTLAEAHGLDTASCVWVVREFARALGLIASGGTQPAARVGPSGGAGPAGAGAGGAGAGGAGAGGAGAGGAGAGAAGAGAAGVGTGGASDGTGSPGMPGEPGVPGGGAGTPGGPAVPPGMPGGAGGLPPRRPPSGSWRLSRNTVGIAAGIALVAGYLGVAAVAHLSPFPAKAVTAASSAPANGGNNASPSPDGSPDPAPDPDPSPTSDYQILLSKIPSVVQGTNNCRNAGTSVGAIAVSQCTGIPGLGAQTIIYYLFSDPAALGTGFSAFLVNEKFRRQSECTSNDSFVDFIAECESAFTSTSPSLTGSIAEYANTSNDPIIVSSDNQQQVMAVMVGTNDGDLLAYWKQLQWVVT